jgi:tripartite-type tricarboxylate transporter receptor subunit TctC
MGAISTSSIAQSEDYPTQVIKVIVPNPPGGPGDVIARIFSEKATNAVGRPFIFEYRPGASTTIGVQAAAIAEPDGHTILAFPSSGLGITLLRKKIPYNLETDFKPIIGLGNVPLALIVRSNLQFKSFADFEASLQKGNLFYGSGGVGTIAHLSSALLVSKLKGSATHVPFRGNPEVVQAIMGGNCDFTFASVADAAAAAGSPQLQVLAVTSDKRFPGMPDVPTMIESGHPEINAKLWYAFLAPAKVPNARILKLYNAFAEAAKDAALQKHLATLGFMVDILDGEGLSQSVREEATRWKRVIEENHITATE